MRTYLYKCHLELGSVIYQLNDLGVICPKCRVKVYPNALCQI